MGYLESADILRPAQAPCNHARPAAIGPAAACYAIRVSTVWPAAMSASTAAASTSCFTIT